MLNLTGVNTKQVVSNEPFDKNEYEKGILKEIMPVIRNPKDKIVLTKSISNPKQKLWNFISGVIAKYYGDKSA